MEKAKAAISGFMHKSGHHDTTVHETVAPGVTHETVKPHQHENINTAVDREVHQDHYHRTVQPVKDREVLPEQHTAKLGAVQHREFDHRDHEGTKRALAEDQHQFKDQRVVRDTTHSQSAAPEVGGEHVHHHIHETIQPVVHKETVQPHVVHTTVPIHETHHNSAQHHETTSLPTMTMDEFKHKGGVLGGREERYDGFEGEPKHIGGKLSGLVGSKEGEHKRDSAHADHHTKTQGMHGDYNPLDGRDSRGVGGQAGLHSPTTGGAGATAAEKLRGDNATTQGTRAGNTDFQHGNTPARGDLNNNTTKPSLMDKLNPRTDTNGDGKRGIMK